MAIKVGDFVEVTGGLGYPGPGVPTIKGRVEDVTPVGAEVRVGVHTTNGGYWVFWASDLSVLPKRRA